LKNVLARRAGACARAAAWSLEIAWLGILVAPAATAVSGWIAMDLDKGRVVLASTWLIACLRVLLARRAFFLVTWPIASLGVLCAGADILREVDLLALMVAWRSYSSLELDCVVSAYAAPAAAAAAALCLLCLAAHRHVPYPEAGRRVRLACLASCAALATMLPAEAWLRAWPANALLAVLSSVSGSPVFEQNRIPLVAKASPRDPRATWHGVRAPAAAPDETVVFVIGETVRADYLHECNGPERVRRVAPGALVACDVSSGSDATITSVPLLVSREMPGHPRRVSTDATFMKALAEAGFETHWFDLQEQPVAWADAEHARFLRSEGADDVPKLVPPLVDALSRPARLKAIVLHPLNAHDPYCIRYDHAKAPYAVQCRRERVLPQAGEIDDFRLGYANAVDASVGFVNRVIEELDKRPEPVFLLYSSDHGENLMDDGRRIWAHAMRRPSRWDTQVPAIFWANAAWRQAHAAQWRHLEGQIHAPLMHADLVPTFLAAAGVRYDEPREAVVDLLTQPVPARRRIVQIDPGAVLDWSTLNAEAREAGAGPFPVPPWHATETIRASDEPRAPAPAPGMGYTQG